jgi:3D (Asp-Asp-Asp) domain-containing protein
MSYSPFITQVFPFFLLIMSAACNGPEARSMEVTATAYNSVKAQTANDPALAAWGDTLKPGMKAIAISRDLLDSGLHHNLVVTIDGLDGQYVVLDKMNRRWTRKIDIFMGANVTKARNWGKQKVTIRWTPAK